MFSLRNKPKAVLEERNNEISLPSSLIVKPHERIDAHEHVRVENIWEFSSK